jgi:hypothetical protein
MWTVLHFKQAVIKDAVRSKMTQNEWQLNGNILPAPLGVQDSKTSRRGKASDF